jgi:hypothetical protein
VLLTKSGGETERQVYFVQSTGALAKQGGKPELALRFDLTVPLARYVAEHEHELNFPVPPLPDAARLSRRARAARAFPRVLPVRHRRDRQGRLSCASTPRCRR